MLHRGWQNLGPRLSQVIAVPARSLALLDCDQEKRMPVYMKYDGVIGEVSAKPHEGWVDLQSIQLGTQRNSAVSHASGGRETSRPSVSEIVVTKVTDTSSTRRS